jgi:hypothetical protein
MPVMRSLRFMPVLRQTGERGSIFPARRQSGKRKTFVSRSSNPSRR